jgi:4-hydroxybenzoate polyprenyltransferase
LGKKRSKKEMEELFGKEGPWWLMYLFFIPLFLIAIVPEGFFTWQVMVVFAVLMSTPFFVGWWLYSDNSPKNKNKTEEGSH